MNQLVQERFKENMFLKNYAICNYISLKLLFVFFTLIDLSHSVHESIKVQLLKKGTVY